MADKPVTQMKTVWSSIFAAVATVASMVGIELPVTGTEVDGLITHGLALVGIAGAIIFRVKSKK